MFYSNEIIEEVRSRNPIVDVIGSYVHLQKKGGNYFGLCPFHNEKTGSFCVSPGKQTYHCFGCGAGGSVISFVMDIENYSFPEAVEKLADRAGMDLPKQEYTKEMKEAADLRTELLQMHKDAALFYVHMLHSEEGKRGMDYFERRKLTPETIRNFGLGFSSARPNILYQYLRKKGYRDDVLKQSGLVTIDERGARDVFWNRVMFPILDTNNRVIAFGGRVMGDGEPKYLNSRETKIFEKNRNMYGLNVARRSREKFFLVCEGYMDVISMHQAGFTNAVASLGTAFTSQHAMIIKRYTEEAILCYDHDNAGKKAAVRAGEILREVGVKTRVLDLAPYKDPDEFMKALGPEEFRKRIDEAINSFLFEIIVLKDGYDFSDPTDKANFFKETAQKLAQFTDELEQNAYTEAVANHFGVDYSALKRSVAEAGVKIGLTKQKEEAWKPKSTTKKREKNSGIKEAERLILTSLAEMPDVFPEVRKLLSPDDFTDDLMRAVAEEVFRALSDDKGLNPGAVVDRFIQTENYKEVAEMFSSTYAEEMSRDERKKVIREAAFRIKEVALEEKIGNTTDANELMALLKQKQELQNRR